MASSILEAHGFFRRPFSAETRFPGTNPSLGPSTRSKQYIQSFVNGTYATNKATQSTVPSKTSSKKSTEPRSSLEQPQRNLTLHSLATPRNESRVHHQQVASPNSHHLSRREKSNITSLGFENGFSANTGLSDSHVHGRSASTNDAGQHLFQTNESVTLQNESPERPEKNVLESWQRNCRSFDALAEEKRSRIDEELHQKSVEIEKLKAYVSKATKLLSSTSEEMTSLRSAFDEMNEKYCRLVEQDISDRRLQYRQLTDMVSDAMSSTSDFSKFRATLEADVKATLEVLYARQKDLEQMLQQRVGDLAEERDRRLHVEQKMEALAASQVNSSANAAKRKDESISEICKRLVSLDNHACNEREFRDQVQQAVERLQEFVRTTESLSQNLTERSTDELNKIKANLDLEKAARKEAEAKVEEFRTSAAAKEEESNTHRCEIENLKEEREALKRHSRSVEQQLENRELSLELQMRAFNSERSKSQTLLQENTTLKKEKKSLKDSLDKTEQSLEEARTDVLMLKADLQSKTLATERQQRENNALQERCATLDRASRSLKQEPVPTIEPEVQASVHPARSRKRKTTGTSSRSKSTKRVKKSSEKIWKPADEQLTDPTMKPGSKLLDGAGSALAPRNPAPTLITQQAPCRTRLSSLRPRRSTRL